MIPRTVPRTIHVVWIGDESRCPVDSIDSWRRLNPGCTLKLWDNAALQGRPWRTAHHMPALARRELAGVADLMRYEILLDEGGMTIDADSTCIRPLDDFLFEHDPFACWENELARPGLIANAFIGASPGNPLIAELVEELRAAPDLTRRLAWEETGPLRLTTLVRRMGYGNLTVFPSHFFLPRHHTGVQYTGPGRVYCEHEWESAERLKSVEVGPFR